MEFFVNNRISERHVACRMALLVGTSGPLAWGPQEFGLPNIVTQTPYGYVWDLGNEFKLTRMAHERYRLSHPDLTAEDVQGMRDFLEWEFRRILQAFDSPQHNMEEPDNIQAERKP